MLHLADQFLVNYLWLRLVCLSELSLHGIYGGAQLVICAR